MYTFAYIFLKKYEGTSTSVVKYLKYLTTLVLGLFVFHKYYAHKCMCMFDWCYAFEIHAWETCYILYAFHICTYTFVFIYMYIYTCTHTCADMYVHVCLCVICITHINLQILDWVIKPVPHDLVRCIRFWRIKSPEQNLEYLYWTIRKILFWTLFTCKGT